MYLNTAENRFNPTFIKGIHKCLDQVESYKGQTALVTISANPKFWSNGVDLDWCRDNPENSFTLF